MLDSLTLPFGPMADKIHAKPLQNLSLKKKPSAESVRAFNAQPARNRVFASKMKEAANLGVSKQKEPRVVPQLEFFGSSSGD